MLFKDVNLEVDGLYRIIEAVNKCKSITKLHVGIVTDEGLNTMASLLPNNQTLIKLEFQESKNYLFINFLFR